MNIDVKDYIIPDEKQFSIEINNCFSNIEKITNQEMEISLSDFKIDEKELNINYLELD